MFLYNSTILSDIFLRLVLIQKSNPVSSLTKICNIEICGQYNFPEPYLEYALFPVALVLCSISLPTSELISITAAIYNKFELVSPGRVISPPLLNFLIYYIFLYI